ncbi:vacuolar protein sorting-associated protein 35 [Pilobolus umbonatus]|nr:vacuolar protein sorting-associated protein 35 [Pilobolus umbonatus]
MLAELRTSLLSPRSYYELYMSTFDSLRYMVIYLKDYAQLEENSMIDLYELVQYATSIIPRLYLMVTAGSVYLSKDDCPVAEVLNDMVEMVRGVQHPLRGLFLRHYLGGMTRDYLSTNTHCLDASIQFMLTNFAEMNKLWVRSQHLGHSRDIAKREMERKELGTLVGTNLVRLSQLEGVDVGRYQRDILPSILNQVINCNDVMAQEYLMEVIIQIFPDEFHINTLKPFLLTTGKLHPQVNIKSIIIALLDRLTEFAKNEAEELRLADTNYISTSIPKDTELFNMFWDGIMELIKTKPEMPLQDQSSLFLSLIRFVLQCYPDRLEYIDNILAYAKEHIFSSNKTLSLTFNSKQFETDILNILLAPTEILDILTLITSFKHYQPLLIVQPYQTYRTVTLSILQNVLIKKIKISKPEEVRQFLEICHVFIREQKHHTSSTYKTFAQFSINNNDTDLDEKYSYTLMAKVVHLFCSDDEDTQLKLLLTAKEQLETGEAGCIKATFPSLIISCMKLITRCHKHQLEELEEKISVDDMQEHEMGEESRLHEENNSIQETSGDEEVSRLPENTVNEEEAEDTAMGEEECKSNDHLDDVVANGHYHRMMISAYELIHQTIMKLYEQCSDRDTQCVQYLCMASQNAEHYGFDEIAYNFFMDAFRIYEDSVSHSRAQFDMIVYGIGSLLTSTYMKDHSYYTTLSTKLTLYSTKLLKKPDQSRAIYLCSHLWDDTPRAVECLQKSLAIADSCIDLMTSNVLFLELLDKYIYYYENAHPLITVKYLNSLLSLIQSHLSVDYQPDQHPTASSSSNLMDHNGDISTYVIRQLNVITSHLTMCKSRSDRYSSIEYTQK